MSSLTNGILHIGLGIGFLIAAIPYYHRSKVPLFLGGGLILLGCAQILAPYLTKR